MDLLQLIIKILNAKKNCFRNCCEKYELAAVFLFVIIGNTAQSSPDAQSLCGVAYIYNTYLCVEFCIELMFV